MRKAYDTILQSEVSVELAARNGGFEPYRYECALRRGSVCRCSLQHQNDPSFQTSQREQ